jgi:2'-5' RNA ligase
MTDWPLHITLADTFAIERQPTDIDSKLATFASERKSFSVSALGDSVLGSTPVVLLGNTKSLVRLHGELITLLEENGAVFNNPEFTKTGFIAHSSIQQNGRLQIGDEACIDSISLIDMFPNEDWQQRRVLATFKFK